MAFIVPSSHLFRGVNKGGGGNCPPYFVRIEGAAAQAAAARHITTCPPSFRKLLTPLVYVVHVYCIYLVGWERRINIELIRHDRYIESVDH